MIALFPIHKSLTDFMFSPIDKMFSEIKALNIMLASKTLPNLLNRIDSVSLFFSANDRLLRLL